MSYASFKLRIYAFLLDYLVIVLYGIFVVGSISLLFRSYINPLFSNSPVIAQITGFFMITLPVSLYFILSESSKWQGTLGKKKMGIRVVDVNGKRIGSGARHVEQR
ncbi:RDD family protein [Bacillus sp. SA1-12]|uniref:RDD family protein n=1 Tax=Bacillus sp. SA1-12 TaxID=1455638 RepID=UPI000AB0FCF8|nr:RDD family protein [Bacillus sp. SA1-12]